VRNRSSFHDDALSAVELVDEQREHTHRGDAKDRGLYDDEERKWIAAPHARPIPCHLREF